MQSWENLESNKNLNFLPVYKLAAMVSGLRKIVKKAGVWETGAEEIILLDENI